MVKYLAIIWAVNVAFSFWLLFRSHRSLEKADNLLIEIAEFHAAVLPEEEETNENV